jgi:hypothetical protein
LIDGGTSRYLASEWLASASWAPSHQGSLSFGLGAGSGLPFSGDAAGSSLAFGVPSFRALGFLRLTPSEQRRR